MGKSIADLVREKYSEPSQCLGEVARVKYRGYDINIMDLMERIKREQKMKLPITKIIKKRADYQKYLENREKKKLNVNDADQYNRRATQHTQWPGQPSCSQR